MGFGGGSSDAGKAAPVEPPGKVAADPNANIYKPVKQNRYDGDTFARPLIAPNPDGTTKKPMIG